MTHNPWIPVDLWDWEPWRPDNYPIRDSLHNPWIPIDPISGMTAYEVWCKVRPITEDDFRRVLADLRAAS